MASYKSVNENLNNKFRRNESITASEVRVIDDKGVFIGIMSLSDALKIAKDKDLDLVEIAPKANPPVCKIISWSKFKYEYSKKQKNSVQKVSQMKEMWFKPMTGPGDLEHKIRKIRDFLNEKNKVKITVKPGRDRRLDKSFYFEQIKKVLNLLEDVAEVESQPKVEGSNVYAIIKRKK